MLFISLNQHISYRNDESFLIFHISVIYCYRIIYLELLRAICRYTTLSTIVKWKTSMPDIKTSFDSHIFTNPKEDTGFILLTL